MSLLLTPIASNNQNIALQTIAPVAQVGAAPCKVFIGAEAQFFHEVGQVSDCFKKGSIESTAIDLASHFFLFVTDSFLKSKEHVLPLIGKLADPHFKQRLFPVIMDPTLSIFKPGEERPWVEYWERILNNTNPQSSEYAEIKAIEENIAPLIRAIRDTLMPPLTELLQQDLKSVIETIEQRSHLLEAKRFFFLPQVNIDGVVGQEANCAKITTLFKSKPVVTLSGQSGMGKTTLAVEYAKRSEAYPTGIFWFDASTEQALQDCYKQLAIQLGMTLQEAQGEMEKMKECLFIYDNASEGFALPKFPFANTLVLGNELRYPDILLKGLSSDDVAHYVMEQLQASKQEAALLADLLKGTPSQLAEAVSYIKTSRLKVQDYVKFYQEDQQGLLSKQKAKQKAIVTKTFLDKVEPSAATIEKYTKQSVSELSRQINGEGLQIFVSYNWGSVKEVDQMDGIFHQIGIELLRDKRELRSFDSIREFMKKVIRVADYTFSIVTDSYIKSFNCLFEVNTTLNDPHWRARVFPIVLNTNLDDAAILGYEKHWQQEAARLENTGGSATEIAIAKEGAQKIGPYLRFVRALQAEPFSVQTSTQFQKTLALMLARQEKLEKKGVYRQGIFHLSQGRNKDFVGREKALDALETALKKGTYSAITNTGMGGVGKSQLALEYAYRHEKEYTLVYWIRSETMDALKLDLRMLGQEMGIAEDFLKDDKLIPTMKAQLEKRKNWLLIFDNAEDPQALLPVLPQRGGHVLITSRNPNWTNKVSVEVFSEQEAIDYLQKISAVTGQQEELKLLAQELGYLPLALTQAAAYIKRQQVNVATYLVAFKEGQKNLLSEHERGYPGSVATAWLISMEKISREDPNALNLLNLCSFLSPDNIPDTLLQACLKEKSKGTSELDFHEALRILESYSLIEQKVMPQESAHSKLISIHRLIQAVTRDECKEEETKQAIKLAVKTLNKQFRGDVGTKKERESGEALIQHAKALIAHAEAIKILTEEIGVLATKGGIFLWSTGDLKGALKMHQKALKIDIASFGTEKHTSVAQSYMNIGIVLSDKGDLNGALQMHQKALKIKIASFGTEEHTEVAENYTNIGAVLYSQGDLKGALEMYQKALKIFIASFGTEEHTEVADSYNNIGLMLSRQGALKGALEMHQKALKIYIARLGTEEHMSVATSYHNIGLVLDPQGDLKGALEMYQKALKIKIACLGTEQHTSVAVSYHNIGLVLINQGDLKGALEMLQKALKIKIACLGTEQHTSVANSYHNIGAMLHKQGDLKGGLEMLQKALKIQIACLGTEQHTSVADSYNNIGLVLEAQGDLKGALEMHQKALKIEIACLGTEQHTNVASSYNNIGLVQKDQGDLKGALEMLQKALKIRIACLGNEEHNNVANGYMNIGEVLLLLKQNEQAKDHYVKAKLIYQKTAGDRYNAFFDGKIMECETGNERKVSREVGESSRSDLNEKTSAKRDETCLIS